MNNSKDQIYSFHELMIGINDMIWVLKVAVPF